MCNVERVAPGRGIPARRAGALTKFECRCAEDGWGYPGDRTREDKALSSNLKEARNHTTLGASLLWCAHNPFCRS